MSDLLLPADLKKIARETALAKAEEDERRIKKQEEEKKRLHESFLRDRIDPVEATNRVNSAVRRAAEQGLDEIQVFTFPASFCNDNGRRINNNLPDWPDSLEGLAKSAYEYFNTELRPKGYSAVVRVLDYPDGVPGTIAFYLKW
jgi:hypothetical protein